MMKELDLVVEVNAEDFMKKLAEVIDKRQGLGMKVEVQYQLCDKSYSALVLSRVN